MRALSRAKCFPSSSAQVGGHTLHYTTLPCRALHYTVLHCTTLHYTTLHFTVLNYTALHRTELSCIALTYTTLICSVLLCTELCCTALHCTFCCTALHSHYNSYIGLMADICSKLPRPSSIESSTGVRNQTRRYGPLKEWIRLLIELLTLSQWEIYNNPGGHVCIQIICKHNFFTNI